MTTILAALLRNESGGKNIANTTQGTSSGQAQGYFQITTGTWNDFGGQKYAPTPLQANYDQQAAIASKIPLKRWDSSTIAAMRATGNPIDPSKTLGENLAMNGETFGTSSASPEPMQYVPINNDNSYFYIPNSGDGSNMTGITSDGTASDGTLTLQSPWDQLSAADANGDGSVTGSELQAYNASRIGAKTAASIKAAGQGTPSDVPTAIVTAANQQALSQSDALKAIAAGAQAANEATNATNTGIWQGLQTWAGGRLLQIMVFILAVIFLGVGLYFFVPKNQLGIPA